MKFKFNTYLAFLAIGLQLIVGMAVALPEKVSAESINGTVTWNNSQSSIISGTKNGKPFEADIIPLYVNGYPAFCIEPGVPIYEENTPGYVGNPATNLPRRAKLAMALWKKVFGSSSVDYNKIAQTVVWYNLEGANKADITHIEGMDDNYLSDKRKVLEDAITAYDLKPSFNNQTIKLTYGESTTIKNTTSGVNLKDFDAQVSNTANVDIKVEKDQLVITPKDLTKTSGTIAFKKSVSEGTPYVYRKEGQQAVATGKINDPNNYLVNFDIETTGNIKIQKLDKVTSEPIPDTEFKVEFSGEGAPKSQTVKTGKDGTATIEGIKDGVHVKAEETSVPKPYVLSSSEGGTNIVEGDVKAGTTITLTKKNNVAKGQIIVDKSGKESNKDMWNENYTLEGNIFDIRKESETGEIVKTITSNADGVAKTSKDLDLGTYFVTEKQSSDGFANTFKPVKVEIKYAGQTVAVVTENAEGTNKEVVGSSILTKEDSETGNETQGKSTFEGAEYSLFYNGGNNKGKPVKWKDAFKPLLTVGEKVDEENVVIKIDSEKFQAGVEHLALGAYYWEETKNPVGYQIDKTKHEFELTYKDQNTQVVSNKKTSKENVIKFKLDGFKYVTSKNGSAQSGYNGIDFSLKPIEPTKGEEQVSTTKTDSNGYDGYWNFVAPYGDYKLEELNAPEGFKTIAPLLINSDYNSEKAEYTFTITEEGQKEALKTVTVSEKEINEGNNVISLSKLFLYDDTISSPSITTMFLTEAGDKEFNPTQDQLLIDNVKQTVDESLVKKEELTLYYVTQFHKVAVDKNGKLVKDEEGKVKEEVVGEVESTQTTKKAVYEFQVPFEYKVDMLKDGEKLVATHIAYTDKEHTKVFAEEFDLENNDQTLTAKVPVADKILPQTGEEYAKWVIIGVLGMVGLGVAFYVLERKDKKGTL